MSSAGGKSRCKKGWTAKSGGAPLHRFAKAGFRGRTLKTMGPISRCINEGKNVIWTSIVRNVLRVNHHLVAAGTEHITRLSSARKRGIALIAVVAVGRWKNSRTQPTTPPHPRSGGAKFRLRQGDESEHSSHWLLGHLSKLFLFLFPRGKRRLFLFRCRLLFPTWSRESPILATGPPGRERLRRRMVRPPDSASQSCGRSDCR
jgi:hypothetical protein